MVKLHLSSFLKMSVSQRASGDIVPDGGSSQYKGPEVGLCSVKRRHRKGSVWVGHREEG